MSASGRSSTAWHGAGILAGFVLNDSRGVVAEVEGASAVIDGFEQALRAEAPPLARIESVISERLPVLNETAFTIVESSQSAGTTLISPDTVPCADCLQELSDPHDRRHGYPFINCTNCGPRFTIIEDVPYDRANTSMGVFPMCAACQAEYDDQAAAASSHSRMPALSAAPPCAS